MSKNSFEPFLDGKNIYLRGVRIDDVSGNYYNWMNDCEVNQYLESRFYPWSKEKLLEYVNRINSDPDYVFLAIIQKEDNIHVGNIKLGPINWIHRVTDIGIIIGEKSIWGKGYATEAINLVTDYAFKKLNLHKLTAGCYKENIGSQKAFEKNGYVIEGVRKSHYFLNGNYTDLILMGIINEK